MVVWTNRREAISDWNREHRRDMVSLGGGWATIITKHIRGLVQRHSGSIDRKHPAKGHRDIALTGLDGLHGL
jgi:hypothetical protein